MVQTDEERKAYAREYYRKNKEYYKSYNQTPESKEKRKAYRNKPEVKEKKKAYRNKPEVKEKRKAYQKEYTSRPEIKINLKEYDKKYRQDSENNEKKKKYMMKFRAIPENKEKVKKSWEKIRIKVYSVYSKRLSNSDIPCCNCCGETTMEFLAVDHIKGRKHLPENEKKLKSKTLLPFLIKNNYPEDYQILCHNCNSAKGFYGICPHEKKRKEEAFAMMEQQSSFEV